MTGDQILWLGAAILFALAAFGPRRGVHPGWLGLTLVALTFVN